MRSRAQRLAAALRFRQLELVTTLADTGNMRAAAQRLHMTTAAVSKSLKELEALFQQELFHRLPRGVTPTAAGTLVVQRSRVLLGEVVQLSDELAAPAASLHERLRVAATPFLAWTLLPRILACMAEAAEDGASPSVMLSEGRLAEISRQLEAGEVDLLVTMDTPSELGSLLMDGLVVEHIGQAQWQVVCAPGHALAPRGRSVRAISWAQASQADWILPPRPTQSRMMLEQTLAAHALPPLIPRIETMSAITHLEMAERGLGLTLAAEGTLADRLRCGSLVRVPLEDLPPPVAIVMVYPRGASYRTRVAAFSAAVQRARSEAGSLAASPSASSKKFSARKSRP